MQHPGPKGLVFRKYACVCVNQVNKANYFWQCCNAFYFSSWIEAAILHLTAQKNCPQMSIRTTMQEQLTFVTLLEWIRWGKHTIVNSCVFVREVMCPLSSRVSCNSSAGEDERWSHRTVDFSLPFPQSGKKKKFSDTTSLHETSYCSTAGDIYYWFNIILKIDYTCRRRDLWQR